MGHLASKISLARLPSLGRPVGNYWQRRAEGLSQGRETASQRTLAGNHRLPAHSLKRLSLPSTYFSTLFVFLETVKTHTHNKKDDSIYRCLQQSGAAVRGVTVPRMHETIIQTRVTM